MNRINILTMTIFALAALSGGCKNRELEAFNALEKDRFIVKTEKVRLRTIEDSMTLVGSVKAMDEAVLYPRISGKLLKNLLKEGDAVKKDDPVALVERDEVGVVFEPAPVPSTLTGVIGKMYQDTGASVTPQTPIALVVDQSQLRVAVDVPERYAGKVFLGQKAYIKVEAFPEESFIGRVYRVSPVVDPGSRSAAVEVLVDNSDARLKSGMFSEVRLVTGSKTDAASVSAFAVLSDEKGGTYIFVPRAGTAVRKDVKTGIKTDEYVQITGGAEPGDDVINFGLYGLKDGSKIKIAD